VSDTDDHPNGMRVSKGKDVFYLLHEHQLLLLLQRVQNGETPDDLLMENWVLAEKTDADEEDGVEGITMSTGSAVILADIDETEEEAS
jgi:hypothetical protein